MIEEIIAINIIFEASSIFIRSVGNLIRIDPEVLSQVRMSHVESVVDYSNDSTSSSLSNVPCQWSIHVGIDGVIPLAVVLMVPLLTEKAIVGNELSEFNCPDEVGMSEHGQVAALMIPISHI